jgi:hypothetical protein
VSVPFESLYVCSKIVVALNDLPESLRALDTAVDVARACNAEIATVSIPGDLPTPHLLSLSIQVPRAMKGTRLCAHRELHGKASLFAQEYGVRATGSIVEGQDGHQ